MEIKIKKVVNDSNILSCEILAFKGIRFFQNLPTIYLSLDKRMYLHERKKLILTTGNGYQRTIAVGQIIAFEELFGEVIPFMKECKKNLKKVTHEHKILCSQWHGEMDIKI